MSLNSYPLIAWGDPEDISASPWVDIGTPGVTGSIADPFGGTDAYTLDDNDGGVAEGRRLPIVFDADGTQWLIVFVKAGTTSGTVVGLWDSTAAAWRGQVLMTWSGGVPTSSTSYTTILNPVACGGGWYAQVFSAGSVIAANTNSLYLYPAGSQTANTGTAHFYVRNAVLLDLPANYRRFARPREGYETAVVPSGSRDSWSYGNEYVRRSGAHWIPAVARDWPVTVSGFQGANESTGVNCGVQAMLLAGMDMQAMTWVPDRSACSVNQSVYLTAPGRDWEPSQEPNGDFSFEMETVTASAPGAVS